MVVVAHRVARQLAGVAQGREPFLGDAITALRQFLFDVGREKVKVVGHVLQSVLGVADQLAARLVYANRGAIYPLIDRVPTIDGLRKDLVQLQEE